MITSRVWRALFCFFLFVSLASVELMAAPQASRRPLPAPVGTVSVVVYVPYGCDYYIAYNNMGYVVLEWYGGAIPSKGDVLRGDINTYGFKDIWNVTQGQGTRVYIEDYLLDADAASETLAEHCN